MKNKLKDIFKKKITPEVIEIPKGLNDLSEMIYGLNAEKGFWADSNTVPDEYFKTTKLALVTTEIAEAIEGVRKGCQDDKLPHYRMEDVEVADALIRLFDYCGAYCIDIEKIIAEKLAYNTTRPYKHGKSF